MKSVTSFTKYMLLFIIVATSAALNAQNAWINEFHYDNISTDVNEFIEVVIENPGDFTLSLFQVVLYNGNGGATYLPTYNLSEFTVGNIIGNFTIYYKMYPSSSGIQNGAPDGMALVYNGSVIAGQFLSYEGFFTATNGPASGMTSVDIGVDEEPAVEAGLSLQLSGTGSQYSHFTWQAPATATAGALNNGQLFSTSGIANPVNFDAVTFSQTQIDLSWLQNENVDDVMVAVNSSNSFGTPSGAYEVDDLVGTATVIYIGPSESFNHSGLVAGNHYYYRAWSVDGSDNYSAGVTDSAYTQFLEPDNHPTGLTAVSNGPVHITVSWTDADADKYLVKGSAVGYSSIVPPVDGISQGDSLLVKNVNASVQSHQFTGLTPSTTYFFKIFPYNGGGESSNYKIDGSVPEASATTEELELDLIITEVTHPKVDPNSKFVEIMNTGNSAIDFSSIPVYLCRQANGSGWASILLQGSLSPGETYVIGNNNTNFSASFGFSADLYNSNVVSGNGNDGYFLYYGGTQASGYLFDSYGIIDEDGIGKAWEYTEKKAVRKRIISTPNSVWTASEWVILPVFSYVADMTPGLHKGEVTWQGTISSNWNEKGTNWNSINGYIPDASCIVTIPNAGNYPIVTEASAVHEVQIQSGSTLSVQSPGSLLIVGP
jgi:hypothetical protein